MVQQKRKSQIGYQVGRRVSVEKACKWCPQISRMSHNPSGMLLNRSRARAQNIIPSAAKRDTHLGRGGDDGKARAGTGLQHQGLLVHVQHVRGFSFSCCSPIASWRRFVILCDCKGAGSEAASVLLHKPLVVFHIMSAMTTFNGLVAGPDILALALRYCTN